MRRRRYLSRFECAAPGCHEVANFESRTRAEQTDTYRSHGNGKWLCVRHAKPDEVLSLTNFRLVTERKIFELPHGRYWGDDTAISSFIFGPGFKAYTEDFPAGTRIRITAEILPPESPT